MELVPIIWSTLLFGSIFLMIVLLVSFIASKLKKNDTKVYDEFNLVPARQVIPDRSVIITRRHENPNIQVTTSKYQKVRVRKETAPRIFDINNDKRESSNRPSYETGQSRKTTSPTRFDGSYYGGSSKRNPRFTILNETLNTSADIRKHLKFGNSYRFTETDFI